MGFKEDIQRLSAQIRERKDHVANEEMVRQVLVMPFLKVLGFDVFNPLEVRPGYTADFGKKKGEKVDYAVFKEGTPVVFIEVKSLSEDLVNHDAQLARYFNTTPQVRFAILTNGVEYKFFTDLNSPNIMDSAPFLTVDVTNLTDADIEVLGSFRKDLFETDTLVKYAEELIYTSNINAKLKELFKNPPDEFIRYLIKDFSDMRITSNVIDRFRPIVKKSISLALLEIVSQGLFQEETAADLSGSDHIGTVPDPTLDSNKQAEAGRTIVTTGEELESLDIVKRILEKYGRDISELNAKDTTIYYGIFLKSVTRWLIRLNLDSTNRHLTTRLPIEQAQKLAKNFRVEAASKGIGESRIYIGSHKDLAKLEELVLACYDNIVSTKS